MKYKIRIKYDKYIFLDIDGVMNSFLDYKMSNEEFMKNIDDIDVVISPNQVKILNQIIDQYNPKIILSSYWRTRYSIDEINKLFKKNHINSKVINFTDDKGEEHKDRWSQIKRYIDKHNIKDYIILDDDKLPKAKNHIKTNSYDGLTNDHIEEIKKIWK